jgi:hypothetical protein
MIYKVKKEKKVKKNLVHDFYRTPIEENMGFDQSKNQPEDAKPVSTRNNICSNSNNNNTNNARKPAQILTQKPKPKPKYILRKVSH